MSGRTQGRLPEPGTGAGRPDLLDHPGVRRVAAALADFGLRGRIVVLTQSARTAADAAAALGVDRAQIASSLVFCGQAWDGTQRPLLVITSGAHRVDQVKVADLLGLTSLTKADPAYVEAHTGFSVGGVAPVAHTAYIETVVDVWLGRHERVWAAAGHPRAVFPTTYDELLRVTAGQPLEVT